MPRSPSPQGKRREKSPARKDSDREREKVAKPDKERDRERDRDGKRRREGSSERGRSAETKRSRHTRSRSRERARDASKPADRDRDRARDRERDKDRAPRPRSSERDRERGRSRDHDRGRSKDRGDGRVSESGGKRPSDDAANGKGRERDAANGKNPEAEKLPQPPAIKKAEPLSLEELLKKREAEALAASKPVFLSKKQREELALKRRQEEVAAKSATQSSAARPSNGQDSRAAERAAAQRAEDRRRDDDRRQRDADREREKELAMIKAQYLGGEKKKKKVLKGAEKFKFNFDWEAGDDTSRDLNPLYNSTHEAVLLFGRGMRAGVDRREQKKMAAGHEAELMRKAREGQGVKETKEDRQRDRNRQALADSYGKTGMKVGSHWTEKSRDAMTERDWRIFREDHNIAFKGNLDRSVLPVRNWAEANLPKELMKAIDKMGYTKPSPIQMAAIPLGLKFRDVIGVAETGSGKTAAFVLPMLTYIMAQPKMTEEVAAEGPYAVIMAPTRELAQQIEEEAIKMAQYTEFRFVCVVGGQNIEDQGFKLRKGCEVIIATPGRLIDCLEQRYAVLNQCNYIVLDEADRMIDLGFEPQVIGVMDAMPSTNLKPEGDEALVDDQVYRTTYMFSATMPPAVERLARKYLRRPIVINIGSAGKAVDLITQRVDVVKDNEKAALLERELSHVGDQRVVVFVNTKRQCDVVAGVLDNNGYSCTILHGGKSQDQREAGLAGFRDGSFSVLVATDVAGRGIDVPDIALVVNYDMPNNIENYTHRIGRTGRAGRKGKAVTFLTMSDSEVFYDLKKFLEEAKAPVPHQLANHEAAKNKPGTVQRRESVVYAKK